MLRLKKEERESPFVYKTPWHIGKRSPRHLGKRSPVGQNKRSAPLADLYTASWIGSLFKPSSEEKQQNMKHTNGMKYHKDFVHRKDIL